MTVLALLSLFRVLNIAKRVYTQAREFLNTQTIIIDITLFENDLPDDLFPTMNTMGNINREKIATWPHENDNFAKRFKSA
jgi:hypothetical protein